MLNAPPLLAAATLIAAACTGPTAALHPIPSTAATVVPQCDAPATVCHDTVEFTYLGVGGFVIRAGNDAVMTAPSFTHPGIVRVSTPVLGRISADPRVIDRELRRFLGDPPTLELSRVRAVLVGHSHYDHAMDVPYVMRTYLPSARLITGLTPKRIFMGDDWLREHRSLIDSIPLDSAATPWRAGQWITLPGDRFRVMALRSSHAPNAFNITIAPWHANEDYDHLPGTAWGWRMGDPYAYLIDVLGSAGQPVFRVLYQDAAAAAEDNLLPPLPPVDQRPVDVSVICAGNFDNVAYYPQVLLGAVRPRFVIVGHWEDFFHSPDDPPTPVRFTDTRALEARLDSAMKGRWATPEPGARIQLTYGSR